MIIFQNEKVDIAIIEVGLGGRLDSTNIIKLLEVSCNNEHWYWITPQFLGDDLKRVLHLKKVGLLKQEYTCRY